MKNYTFLALKNRTIDFLRKFVFTFNSVFAFLFINLNRFNPFKATIKVNNLLVLSVAFLGFSSAFGQVANYTFSESAGTYSSTTGTTSHASGWDDAVTTNTIPIGFTFNFNGTNYTTCSINSNGYITFGATTSSGSSYTPISSVTGYDGAISPIGFDLISNSSTIIYTTTGTIPNRIFIVQWNNARRYSGGAIVGDDFNFQIRLSETTNIIDVVYGTCTPVTNTVYDVQVGLRGAANTDYNNRSLTTNVIWGGNTTAGVANTSTCRTRSNAYPLSGRTFRWTPPTPPTITSLSNANGCVGSSLTVNGTNLSGATAVTIGGTAATITGNTATTVTVTVGAGTTGTVQVTTPSGSAVSAATFTVNPLPANPGNPTSNSPQCNPPGVTLTRVGSPPGGETWYWQTTSLGTSTTASGTTYVVSTSGTYYIRAQNNTTGCWSAASGSLAVTVSNLSGVAATPSPTNSATGVCYAGPSPITSVSWGAVTGATSYDVYFGAGSLPGSVTANVGTNSYSTGTLAPNTTYYWQIVPKNACGITTGSPVTWTFTTASVPCYCTPTFTTGVEPISNVTFNTINNSSSNTCSAGSAYENFSGTSTSATKGSTHTLSVTANTCGNYTNYIRAYFDWNIDGDFDDAGESYDLGTIFNTTTGLVTLPITIPVGAATGAVRMRIMKRFSTYSTDACQTGSGYGQAEDYTINITNPPACTTPTAQPTALILTPAGTSIAGSFTAASPVSDSYLVVVSNSATPPSAPVNGTTYAIGSSLASGYIVVDNDTNTTFTAFGLNTSTTYYFYIFSFNGLCTGGPLYNITSPLLGNSTTTGTTPTYCTPSSTNASAYISSIRSVGTINDVVNGPTGYSAGGYGNYSATTIATQIAGSGINLEIIVTGSYGTGGGGCPSTSQFIKTWVDWNKDGDFDDAGEQVYVSGTDAAPVATALDNIYGFVVPSGTFPGNYRMRVRTRAYCDTSALLPCATGYITGETEDYTIAIIEDCPSKILSVTNGSACGPTNTVTLNATKTASATGFKWYTALTGGAPIATTGTGSWTTPSISTTTTYYVTAYDGVCETIHRTPVVATILTTTNITVTPSVPEVCGEGNVVQIDASGDFVTETLLFQNFESGMAPFTVTTPTNTNGGPDTPWSVKTSVYVPSATSVWRPALNSGAIGTKDNKFAFTTSDYNNSNIQTIMTSPVINASIYTSLNLTFDQMYGAFSGDSAIVEAWNGATWTTVATYTATDIGSPSVFAKMGPINLNAYAGNPNLQIRFVYTAQWDDGWAVDNIKVEGVKPLNTTFTWTGGTVDAYIDAGLTTPYVAQSVSTVYVKPTAMQLASPSWSFTANATLGNGCPVSKLVTVNNKTKLWKGGSSADWYDANNWEPVGVPDANTCVYIYNGPFTSNINTAGNNGFAKILTVRPSGLLEIQANNNLTVTDGVTVDGGGTFNIESSGSLIQVNNVANVGNISMKRNTNIKRLDYVYWSTPVAGFGSSAISPGTPTSVIWKWQPTINNGGTYAGNFGNWINGNETMVNGKGYIVRGPNSYTTTAALYTANFMGVPNNGNITTPITRSTYTGANYAGPTATPVTKNDDNWNLLGNPYPSSISADAFLAANSTNLEAFVKVWTHGIPPLSSTSDPFYQAFTFNYSLADYITYNALGGTQYGYDGFIGAGQGFFVLMTDAASTTENAVFNNSMRSNTQRNDQFFRTSEENNPTLTEEKHRIWLDFISPFSTNSAALIGYTTNATKGIDTIFDAPAQGVKTNFELYSIIENEGFLIQGRNLPFDETDRVPLGVAIPQNGIYTIAINAVDGLFSNPNQNIYLEDTQLAIIHDIKNAPYMFTGTVGRNENRFVLRYTNNNVLSQEAFDANNSLRVVTNENATVYSTIEKMSSIEVYDLLGKKIKSYSNIDANEFMLYNLTKNNATIVLKIKLNNGTIINKKVIF